VGPAGPPVAEGHPRRPQRRRARLRGEPHHAVVIADRFGAAPSDLAQDQTGLARLRHPPASGTPATARTSPAATRNRLVCADLYDRHPVGLVLIGMPGLHRRRTPLPAAVQPRRVLPRIPAHWASANSLTRSPGTPPQLGAATARRRVGRPPTPSPRSPASPGGTNNGAHVIVPEGEQCGPTGYSFRVGLPGIRLVSYQRLQ
jgi:hypothetical protein